MTAPTPQSKTKELIDSINEMVLGEVNEEHLAEIVVAANKMKDSGQYTNACVVLGMIAALRGDSAEVDRLFNAAILHSGREVWVLDHYATALNNLGWYAAAIKIIDEAVSLSPGDLSLLKKAIGFHRHAFDVEGVRELVASYKALGKQFPDDRVVQDMTTISAFMAEHNIAWPDIASRIELASGVLRQFGLFPQSRRQSIDDGILMLEFQIAGDVESISRAESAMNDAIAEEKYSPVDDCLFLTCSTV